jgi:NAD(P)-dependent dehydrogenase (short-subunit alcohol dehydrogenase family)
MKTRGHDFSAVEVDVTDFESCQRAIATVQADQGPVDVLVNNAGITRDMTFRRMDKTAQGRNRSCSASIRPSTCDGRRGIARGSGP